MIPPLQIPWVRAEFDRHADVLAQHDLLWHFKDCETPEIQSTSRPMDDELERYVLERMAAQHARTAERDRLVVLEQLNVARPSIERQLKELRDEKCVDSPSDKLRKFENLAMHLRRLGGHRDAWNILLSEYHRLEKLVDLELRLEVAIELAEMMLDDGVSDQAILLLHDLKTQTDPLPPDGQFRFKRLLARGYLEQCDYTSAQAALQEAAELALDVRHRDEQLAILAEARLLQGDFHNIGDALPESEQQ